MPCQNLLSPPPSSAPWHITTERTSREESSIHTLYYGTTATETRIGPHGLSILSDIRDHLNRTGGKPSLRTLPIPTVNQPTLF